MKNSKWIISWVIWSEPRHQSRLFLCVVAEEQCVPPGRLGLKTSLRLTERRRTARLSWLVLYTTTSVCGCNMVVPKRIDNVTGDWVSVRDYSRWIKISVSLHKQLGQKICLKKFCGPVQLKRTRTFGLFLSRKTVIWDSAYQQKTMTTIIQKSMCKYLYIIEMWNNKIYT